MVIYEITSNHIFAELIKSIHEGRIIEAYNKIQAQLTSAGINPNMHIIDNGMVSKFRAILLQHVQKIQIVPPYIQRVAPPSIRLPLCRMNAARL